MGGWRQYLSPSGLAVLMVKFYQCAISPWLPPACRFHPTCSQYSVEAFKAHGFVKGLWLTVWRILRCQPFCKGGYDPVPPPKVKNR